MNWLYRVSFMYLFVPFNLFMIIGSLATVDNFCLF